MSDANPPDRRDRFRGQHVGGSLAVEARCASVRPEPPRRMAAGTCATWPTASSCAASICATALPSKPYCAKSSRSRFFTSPATRHVGRSFQEPDAAWSGNLDATRSLYEATVALGRQTAYPVRRQRSGLRRQRRSRNAAHARTCLLRPNNPYAASKAAADLLSYQFTRDPGLSIVIARPFNHIGPRQSPDFAVASVCPPSGGHRARHGSRRCWRPATSVRAAT